MLERHPLLPRLIILLAAMLACAPLLRYGATESYDLKIYLSWMKYFTDQLISGEMYPRWLVSMNRMTGSPVFYYYPPLAYYIAAVPKLLFPPIDLITQHAIAETTLIALSGLTFHRYARPRFGALPGLFASLVYMILPYHFENALWTRHALSEVANYIWLPLVIDYTERLFDNKNAMTGLSVAYAAMIFTHPPTALLFSLCLAAYAGILALPHLSCRLVARFFSAISLGILLAAIYWIPAIFCQKYIHAEKWWSSSYFDFHLWFLPHPEMVKKNPPTAIYTNRLFEILCLTTMIFVLSWLSALHRCTNRGAMKRLLACLAMVAMAWFLMTPWSLVLWETLPLLWKVQFPSRISVALDLATAIAVAFMANNLYIHRDRLAAMIAMAIAGLLAFTLIAARVHFVPPDGYQEGRSMVMYMVAMGEDAPEYKPRWWNPARADDSWKIMNAPAANGAMDYDQKNGRIMLKAFAKPHTALFDVDLQKNAVLTIHQYYFPSWRARIADTETFLDITPAMDTGLIQVTVPAGKYRLQIYMVPLWEEIIGMAASGFALLFLLGRTVWLYRKNKRGLQS